MNNLNIFLIRKGNINNVKRNGSETWSWFEGGCLMKIKEQVVSASFQYHKDIDARLEGIQIGDSSFRLVKTAEDGESEYKNYLVKTPQNYSIFNFRDVLKGRVRTLSTFTLHEIRNSETRKSFAKKRYFQ